MKKQRVVISGLGMVSPLGHNASDTWQALLDGTSGIGPISSFDASKFPTTFGAEVKGFQPSIPQFARKIYRKANGFTQFALAASLEAMEDAGIRPTDTNAERWGLVGGSGMVCAGFDFWDDFQREYAKDGNLQLRDLGQHGLESMSPTGYGKVNFTLGVSLLAELWGIKGPVQNIHTACASGGQAVGLAFQAIARGDVDYALAGGFDSMLNPIGLSQFCLLGALSKNNGEASTASRPFDLSRDGFVLGEGAAFLVLETWESAKARKAKIYAEIVGDGNTLSCYRITDSPPDGSGASDAIEQALMMAGIDGSEVDYINAHGTSTKMNDLSETNAIKKVLGDAAYEVPVSSTKSQTGHLIAAAGAIEAAFCALAIANSRVPMTSHLKTRDPDCDLNYCADGPLEKEVRYALSHCFGFGGTNHVLALKHGDL